MSTGEEKFEEKVEEKVEEKIEDIDPLADYKGPWIKKRIEFHYEPKHSITLFGSWNRFKGSDDLEYQGDDTYAIEVDCPLGHYVYRFLIDNQEWETDNSLAKKIVDGVEYNALTVKENEDESEEEHSEDGEAKDENEERENNDDDDDDDDGKDKSLVYDQSTGQFVVSKGKKRRGRPSMEIELPSAFVKDIQAQKPQAKSTTEPTTNDAIDNEIDINAIKSADVVEPIQVKDKDKKKKRKAKKQRGGKPKPKIDLSELKQIIKQKESDWTNAALAQQLRQQQLHLDEINRVKTLWKQERQARVEMHNKILLQKKNLQKELTTVQGEFEKLKKKNEIGDSGDKKLVSILEEEKLKQQQEIEILRKSLRNIENNVSNIHKENVKAEQASRAQNTDFESERKKLINEINNLKAEISSLQTQNDLLAKNCQTFEITQNKTKQLESERSTQIQKHWEDEKNEILKKTNEIKQVKLELLAREKELQNEKESKNNIEKEKEQAIKRANEYQDYIKNLESDLKALKNNNESEAKIKIELNKAKQDFEIDHKQFEEKINVLEKRLNEQKNYYESDIKKMKEQFSSDMNSVSEKSDKESGARIEELRKSISQYEDEIRDSKNKILKLETFLNEEKLSNQALDKKFNNIQQDYTKLNEEKISIEKKHEITCNELNNIKNESKKSQDQLSNVNQEASNKIKSLENEIANLRSSHNNEVASFEQEKKIYQDQIEKYKNDALLKSKEEEQTNKQLTSTQQELQNCKISESTLKTQVETLKSQLENEAKDSSQKLKTYESKITQLEENIETINNEKNTKIHDLEDTLSKTKDELSNISNKYTTSEINIQKLNAEIESITTQFKKEKIDLENQLAVASSKGQKIMTSCKILLSKFQTLRTEMDEIRNQKFSELEKINEFFPNLNKLLNKAFGFHQDMVDNLMQKYKRELTLRRKYFNIVQDLRGNIRVFCRIRPMLKAEIEQKLQSPFTFPNDGEVTVTDEKGNKNLFSYDRVYAPNTTQAQVSEDTTEYIQSVMDGYNVSIFAYGQTGSGKTYTMEGPPENPGVNLNALKTLFQLSEERAPMFEYKIKVSIFEIYNEKIKDLIANLDKKKDKDKKEKKKDEEEHKILHLPDGGVEVTGLSWLTVKSLQDVINLNIEAKKNRSLAATAMNSDSSRSHMLLVVDVHGFNVPANIEYSGKLYLVDLAGSERVKKSAAEGQTLKEAQNINKSLAALGDVMQALQQKSKFIPYRNSTLTDLMANALGGNAKTVMFVNCRPTNNDTFETVSSLKFAERAGKVEMGQVKKNIAPVKKPADAKADAKPSK